MIKIDDLIPLLKTGFVAMDENNLWWWYDKRPHLGYEGTVWLTTSYTKYGCCLSATFDIAPFDGGCNDSLIEIKAKEGISDPTNTKDKQ